MGSLMPNADCYNQAKVLFYLLWIRYVRPCIHCRENTGIDLSNQI